MSTNIYLCKSPRKLSPDELKSLAKDLECHISEIGKERKKEKWNYCLEEKTMLTPQDAKRLAESGLTLLLGQQNRYEKETAALANEPNVIY